MRKINFNNIRTIAFKNSFAELTVGEFAEINGIESAIDKIFERNKRLAEKAESLQDTETAKANKLEELKIEKTKIENSVSIMRTKILEVQKDGNVEALRDYTNKQKTLVRRFELISEEIEKTELSEDEPQVDPRIFELEAEVFENLNRALMLRIEFLSILSGRQDETREFFLTTEGVEHEIIKRSFVAIKEDFGVFEAWFDTVTKCRSFKFKDFRKSGLIRRNKKTEFVVSDLKNTTVLRDAFITSAARNIGHIKTEFARSSWKNLSAFVAYACRPKNEEREYSVSSTSRFIGGPRFESLNAQDRLEAYETKLNNVATERKKIFENLNLKVAFGVFKQYFFFKSELTTRYSELYPKGGSSASTPESKFYNDKFGTEASVEDLREVSGQDSDKIWLYSVELFHKELLKFNLRTKARNAEEKQAIEQARKNQAKK